jgi:hypothetical protein
MVSCKILLCNMLCVSFDIHKGPTRGASGGHGHRKSPRLAQCADGPCSAWQGYQNKLGAWKIFKKHSQPTAKYFQKSSSFSDPRRLASEVVTRGMTQILDEARKGKPRNLG